MAGAWRGEQARSRLRAAMGDNIAADLQGMLDGVGTVPFFGEVADGMNGLISLGRGNKAQATLSFGAMIPFLGWGATAMKFAEKTAGKELFNFGAKAAEHMADPARAVPVQVLEQAIKGSVGVPDPRGSAALMHYIEMSKNGKLYNLEVLYDETSNSIWHFKYSTK